MIFSTTFQTKRFDRKYHWVRRYWRIHLLLFVIPLWIDNYRTDYINANGTEREI